MRGGSRAGCSSWASPLGLSSTIYSQNHMLPRAVYRGPREPKTWHTSQTLLYMHLEPRVGHNYQAALHLTTLGIIIVQWTLCSYTEIIILSTTSDSTQWTTPYHAGTILCCYYKLSHQSWRDTGVLKCLHSTKNRIHRSVYLWPLINLLQEVSHQKPFRSHLWQP